MTEGYHYTACGLDYVYLHNGYEVRETPHGRAVAIQDARGLHEAIARAVISSPGTLRGQEVRFLRAQLKLSQEGLAKALRTKRGSVARWEAKPRRQIPGTADSALRMFYALKAEKHEVAERLVDLLTEVDELEHKLQMLRGETFRATAEGWEREREAA
jgi:DNA-binding transcriptional regulator YiaG